MYLRIDAPDSLPRFREQPRMAHRQEFPSVQAKYRRALFTSAPLDDAIGLGPGNSDARTGASPPRPHGFPGSGRHRTVPWVLFIIVALLYSIRPKRGIFSRFLSAFSLFCRRGVSIASSYRPKPPAGWPRSARGHRALSASAASRKGPSTHRRRPSGASQAPQMPTPHLVR